MRVVQWIKKPKTTTATVKQMCVKVKTSHTESLYQKVVAMLMA